MAPLRNILTFHRIMPTAASYFIPPMAMQEQTFAGLADRLAQGRRVMPLRDLALGTDTIRNKPPVALTFDDGYLDNYTIARPILLRLGINATFFIPIQPIDEQSVYWWDHLHFLLRKNRRRVCAWLQEQDISKPMFHSMDWEQPLDLLARSLVQHCNTLDQNQRAELLSGLTAEFGPYAGERLLMNWEEIRQLAQEGFEIGSHTIRHVPLTDLDDAQAHQEIQDSKHQLAERIQHNVNGFCYPRGQYAENHTVMVQQAGYAYAVTTQFGGNGPSADPFALSRRNMSDYQDVRRHFPIPMHLLELTGKLDWLFARRRSG